MRRFAAAVLFALAIPAAASAASTSELLAQIAALQAQILSLQQRASGVSAALVCDLPASVLRRGSSGPDVSRLQEFLARDSAIYPEASVTGYFGALTERAVQRWQVKFGIVLSGTPQTTGFGVVGPRTLSAMRSQWCLQAELTPSPFTPPAGSFVPNNTNTSSTSGTSLATATPRVIPQPHIMFTSPAASTTVTKGNTVVAAWKSDGPVGASVTLSLQSKFGQTLGVLKRDLAANGSYYWTVPVAYTPPITGTCTADPITCLSQIAQTSSEGCTTLCNIENGLYKFYARLLSGATELASAESRVFSIGGVGLTSADITNAGTYWDFSATSSFASVSNQFPATPPSSPAQMCMYSGVPYSEGITIEINCADVTAPKASCGNFGGMKLSCKAGKWVDKDGNPQTVPGVTTTGGAGSCITPWNAMLVNNGQQVPREPFFTNGTYPSGGMPVIMKCSNGSWLTCDTVGDGCR